MPVLNRRLAARSLLKLVLLSIAAYIPSADSAELLNGAPPAQNTPQRVAPRPQPETRRLPPAISPQTRTQSQQNGGGAASTPTVEAPPRPAQTNATGIQAWAVQCADNGKNCLMLRRVLRPDDQTQILAMTIGRNPNSPEHLLGTVMLPLGIAVREAVPIVLDERYLASVPIETCVQAGCVLTFPLPPPLLEVLQKASAMKFLLLTPTHATLPITLSMQGFQESLERVKKD